MDTFRETARIITSKPVQRAVVNSFLLVSGAATLFALAAIASALFFQNFVPDQFVTTPLHLQYGSSNNPYGVTALPVSLLKSQQDYDISVTLAMPRSPPNIERGNFMVSLYLLDSKTSDELAASALKFANGHAYFEQYAVLFKSRRPALVPYVDPIISLASRILFLFYHLLFPSSQTCTMRIPLAERVMFTKDSAIPATAYVEVEAGQAVQIYEAALTMAAQLSGLRWLMFHYRLPTYLAFTTLFWLCEVLFMSVAWTVLSSTKTSPPSYKGQGKLRGQDEFGDLNDSDRSDPDDDQSDHPHIFPTYGKQPPLKHEPGVKKEEKEEESERPLTELPLAGAEADDEDEEVGDRSPPDSGIGTSYSEAGSSSVRKRPSHSTLE